MDMRRKSAKSHLGCQIWLESSDTKERVEQLFRSAAACGLGWARIFLMWPWIERKPGSWKYDPFDWAFDAAERNGMLIKATLTANSGPWHLGTPSMLHSFTGTIHSDQREKMSEYVRRTVQRYKGHAALGQWMLWNEPSSGTARTPYMLDRWREWLNMRYRGDIEALNDRWLTGYSDFAGIPFPEDIPHPLHQGSVWNSYRPRLDDCRFRAWLLVNELEWIKGEVARWDERTETCVNPVPLLSNIASQGVDLHEIGKVVDVVGASYHPAWHFTFAERDVFPALMAAGVRYQAAYPTIDRVEVSEVQTGNTLNSSHRPSAVKPEELAKFYLASLAAGAESVTGWLFNVRSRDFEAGDWGLLDDLDQPSARTTMMKRVHDTLDRAIARAGQWKPAPAQVWVAYNPASQAIEWVETGHVSVPGRLADDGSLGGAMLTTFAMACGFSATHARLHDLPEHGSEPGMIIVSHVAAWEHADAMRMLSFAESGGTLLFDATCGRKDEDAGLHRPWPGGWADTIGLRAIGLESNPGGYELTLSGLPAGRTLLTRIDLQLDPQAGWTAWEELTFAIDGESCLWERPFGKGKIIVFRGMLGPTAVHSPDTHPAIRHVIRRAGSQIPVAVRPHPQHACSYAIRVHTEQGEMHAVIAPSRQERQGRNLRVMAEPGQYHDFWTDSTFIVDHTGEWKTPSEDGIALLWDMGRSSCAGSGGRPSHSMTAPGG